MPSSNGHRSQSGLCPFRGAEGRRWTVRDCVPSAASALVHILTAKPYLYNRFSCFCFEKLLLARVAALRVAGRIPVAGCRDGWDPLLGRRSMRVRVAVCVRACMGNDISVSLTPVAVAARAASWSHRRDLDASPVSGQSHTNIQSAVTCRVKPPWRWGDHTSNAEPSKWSARTRRPVAHSSSRLTRLDYGCAW